MLQRNWSGLFHCAKQQRSLKEGTFSSDKVAHSTKPISLALFPFSGNCRYPGLNLSISWIFDSICAKTTFLANWSFNKKNVFFLRVCFHRMLNVDTICLIPKHKRKLKMKKRVTTFASDTPEDSMVQNDKDVDALMHLKITVQHSCFKMTKWNHYVFWVNNWKSAFRTLLCKRSKLFTKRAGE